MQSFFFQYPNIGIRCTIDEERIFFQKYFRSAEAGKKLPVVNAWYINGHQHVQVESEGVECTLIGDTPEDDQDLEAISVSQGTILEFTGFFWNKTTPVYYFRIMPF